MTEYPAPPDEAEPLDIDAVMAERSRVRRGVASGEPDPEAMHASNRSMECALSRLAPQAHPALGGPTPPGSGGESDPPSSRQAVWGQPRENPGRRPKDRATSQH